MKRKKKVGEVGGGGGEDQGRCEWRSEAFVKIQKNIYILFFLRGGRVEGGGVG